LYGTYRHYGNEREIDVCGERILRTGLERGINSINELMITFDDFKKVEIRIGRIVSAEKIPEGDKLLKLSVDFGTETRQIMSGIAEFFPDPSVLVGRQAPFVVNLETRVLRGYESNGMILATDGEKGIVLLYPADEVPNGSLVK